MGNKLLNEVMMLAIIFISNSCNGQFFENYHRWQILHVAQSNQIVLFNINDDFYSYYSEDLEEKYSLYDSVKNDILLIADNTLYQRSFDYYDSIQKKNLHVRTYRNDKIKVQVLGILSEKYLLFTKQKELFGLYQLSRIECFDNRFLIFLNRIVDLPK